MSARVLPAALVFSTAGLATAAETRLVLLGGGRAPEAALARFVEWAGGRRAHILVLPWGAVDARDGFEAVRDWLRPFAPGVVEAAPSAPLREDARAELRRRLERAPGIFLAGGDPERVPHAPPGDGGGAGPGGRDRGGGAARSPRAGPGL